MSSVSNDEGSTEHAPSKFTSFGGLRLGLLATASAFAGGVAVALWYRDTLKKLRNPVISSNIQKMGSFDEFPDADQDDFDQSEPGAMPKLVQD